MGLPGLPGATLVIPDWLVAYEDECVSSAAQMASILHGNYSASQPMICLKDDDEPLD